MLWSRKGSAAHNLRLLKTMWQCGVGLDGKRNDQLDYGNREFSIDETPAFRFCIAPSVLDTPGVYNDDHYFFCDARQRDVDCGLL